MKEIFVVGCSNTEGDELYDEYIFDNYWDFLKIPVNQYLTTDINFLEFNAHMQKIHETLPRDEYIKKCKELAWPQKLREELKHEYKILDHSLGGSGIDFFQHVYNSSFIENENIEVLNRRGFKDYVLGYDILIWQLTEEPRHFLKLKNEPNSILTVNVETMEFNLKCSSVPKWKRKIILDYYINIFDSLHFFKQKMNFLDSILYQRALNKKHTIIFSVFNHNLASINYSPVKSEYVHWGSTFTNPNGIVAEFVKTGLINQGDTYQKYRHPSKKVQILIAEYLNKYLKEQGIL
jgi:hypothetical protein